MKILSPANKKINVGIVTSLASLIFLTAVAKAQLKLDLPVEKFKLANGLTVLLSVDHSVPLISYHTWYRVGSRDEWKGVTGAAHMLEHMMFKGAKKYTGKQFDQILHENGIVNNAFTTHDYTGYYENLPSSKLDLIMDVEVDRMRYLAINPEDLKSELEVVGEERRWRVDNNPGGLLREMILGEIFKVHPYTWPVIGYMKDIKAYTSENLRKFYDQFYVPNNAVLVIAGDFDPEVVKKKVEKYYGNLEPKTLPARNYPQEPDRTRPLAKTLPWEVQTKSMMVAFKGVAAGTEDSFALDLVSNILAGGRSSRLHKNLVYQQQTANAVGAYNMTNIDPGAFMVSVTMKPGKDTKDAETAVLSEISKLAAQDVTDKELEKAKNQTMMEYIEGLNTIDGKAQTLAVNEITYGDYSHLFKDLETYQKVSKEDVRRVVKKYLASANKRVTGVLEPKKK